MEYKNKDGNTSLCLKNYEDDYWDGGDFSILSEQIEKSYTSENAREYEKQIYFMADVLFIYDRIPFLSGIKNISYSKDNKVISETYISKSEIDEYIEKFHVKMNNNF